MGSPGAHGRTRTGARLRREARFSTSSKELRNSEGEEKTAEEKKKSERGKIKIGHRSIYSQAEGKKERGKANMAFN